MRKRSAKCKKTVLGTQHASFHLGWGGWGVYKIRPWSNDQEWPDLIIPKKGPTHKTPRAPVYKLPPFFRGFEKGLAGGGWRQTNLKTVQKVLQKCVPLLLRGHRKRVQKKGLNLWLHRKDFFATTPSDCQPLFETSDFCEFGPFSVGKGQIHKSATHIELINWFAGLDERHRERVIAESLARVIAAIRIASVRWRSYISPKPWNESSQTLRSSRCDSDRAIGVHSCSILSTWTAECLARVDRVRWTLAIGDWRFRPSKFAGEIWNSDFGMMRLGYCGNKRKIRLGHPQVTQVAFELWGGRPSRSLQNPKKIKLGEK